MNSSVQAVFDWIKESGIQSKSGGFYAWHDLNEKKYSYIYPEITGYGITTLLYLYSISRDKILLKNAKRAGTWIIKKALHPCGGVRTRLFENDKEANELYSFSGEKIFSFDTGMVLYGMVNLYKITNDKNFLKASERMAQFLVGKMQTGDGSLHAIYDSKKHLYLNSYDKWSTQPGGFHAKAAMGLCDLFHITLKQEYKDAAIRLCEFALTTQGPSGRFITCKQTKTTNLHPHCYTAEGLVYTGSAFGIDVFIKSAQSATKWAFKNISSEGIDELYDPSIDSFNGFQRCDVIAQLLRLGIIFSLQDKIDFLSKLLKSYQYFWREKKQNGGFLYSKTGADINSWCSMFALQAMVLADSQSKGVHSKKIDLFI
ncbi:hypothetical protein ACFL0T_08720 [Candidatus Omnitrophota bacterium]